MSEFALEGSFLSRRSSSSIHVKASLCYKSRVNFTLYPIRLSGLMDGNPFDTSQLPFEITEGVQIEAVNGRFAEGAFDLWKHLVGGVASDALTSVQFALVHRYDEGASIVGARSVDKESPGSNSEVLVRMIGACLRLLRPMRQQAFLMHGRISEIDGTFEILGFDDPPSEFIEVPEVQKLFSLRNQDAEELRVYAPKFLQAMRGQFDKFRFAVRFHELGYFNYQDWEVRYLLWCSAIEAIYTSNHPEHRGSLVAKSRIEWFLGKESSIYAIGDLSEWDTGGEITVGKVVGDLYKMRNFIAHGDRVPSNYFTEFPRHCVGGGVNRAEVLHEGASFIIRASLLRILRDDLLGCFANAGASENYFGSQGLVRSKLQEEEGRRKKGR